MRLETCGNCKLLDLTNNQYLMSLIDIPPNLLKISGIIQILISEYDNFIQKYGFYPKTLVINDDIFNILENSFSKKYFEYIYLSSGTRHYLFTKKDLLKCLNYFHNFKFDTLLVKTTLE